MTILGEYINVKCPGVKFTYLAQQADMTKHRLHYLMHNEKSKLTFEEALGLVKVLGISLDELATAYLGEKQIETA